MHGKLSDIKRGLAKVREAIEDAALSAGRESGEIELLAVSKGFSVEKIKEAIKCGIHCVGENRVQEAAAKSLALYGQEIKFDLIGPLQKNKAKKAAALFTRIHSIESEDVASALSKHVSALGKSLDVLVQVNCSDEATKHGLVNFDDVRKTLEFCAQLPGLKPIGVMTLGPYPPKEVASRKAFASLRNIRDRSSKELNLDLPSLSMGMSDDMKWAIEEGATVIRVGRAIFGDR